MPSTTISLSRHSSLKTSCYATPIASLKLVGGPPSRYNSSSSSKAVDSHQRPQNCYRLPAELIELIVHIAYQTDRSFSAIAGFAAACHSFHQIALRCVCSNIRIRSTKCWGEGMPDIQLLAGRVKVLCGFSQAFSTPKAINLKSFQVLHKVHISFLTETIANQDKHVSPILDVLPAQLTSLTFSDLSVVGLPLMSAVAQKFISLETLVLSSAERLDNSCCLTCFFESGGCVWHSPIPDIFPTAEKMALAIGNALRPLTQLTDLHLGFFVSPESVFDEHIAHCAVDAQPPGPEWCPTCFAAHAGPVRAAELATTMVLVQKLPKVERVTWASFFARRHQESRTTVVWVQRSEGRIRVRRKPW